MVFSGLSWSCRETGRERRGGRRGEGWGEVGEGRGKRGEGCVGTGSWETVFATHNTNCGCDTGAVTLHTSMVIRHLLHCVAMLADVHDGDSGDLPQATLQITVTRGHDVALVLRGSEGEIT